MNFCITNTGIVYDCSMFIVFLQIELEHVSRITNNNNTQNKFNCLVVYREFLSPCAYESR